MRRKVLIGAGGTGGHLLPAQELAELLEKKHDCVVLFAGYKLSTTPFFQRERFAHREIVSAPLTSNPFRLIYALSKGFLSAFRLIVEERPDVVVGFGSYHSVPVLLAALSLRKKIVLFEPNRVMGKVNRLFAPFAKAIATQFPLIKGVKSEVTIPLFPWIEKKNPPLKKDALRQLGLSEKKQTVLVFGGSQGASFLNDTIPSLFAGRGDLQVIHLTGKEESALEVKKLYEQRDVEALVKGYETNMALLYSASDVAICRSGAGTTAELIRFSLPSLLIPYPYAADDHQRHNAELLQKMGGAVWIRQEEATLDTLQRAFESLDTNAMRLALTAQKEQHGATVEFDALIAQCGGWK